MFFVDEARNVLVAANPLTEVPTDIIIPMGKGIAGTVALEKKTLNIPNAYDDPRFDKTTDKSTGFATRSVLCAAVTIQQRHEKCVAVIEALNKRGGNFDDEDVFVLETISQELRRPLRRAALEHAFRGACRRASQENDLSILTMLFDDGHILNCLQKSASLQEVHHPRNSSKKKFASFEGDPAAAGTTFSDDEEEEEEEEPDLLTFRWDVTAQTSDAAVVKAIVWIMERDSTLEIHGVHRDKLHAFLWAIRRGYHDDVAYHNFEHGVCVLHAAFVISSRSSLYRKVLGPLDVFALKLAALAHDVDHPGFNNDFEIKTQTRRALLYNDVSVLENHHASYLFATLRRPECNVLEHLDRNSYTNLRRTVVTAILATDMAKHADHVAKLRDATPEAILRPFLKGDERSSITDLILETTEKKMTATQAKQFLVDVAVHLGDLINATHPDFDVAKKWGFRIIAEFKAQATLEAELGLPVSPTMATLETDDDIAHAQIGFVDYVVAPLVVAAADLLPELRDLEDNLSTNRGHWVGYLQQKEDQQSEDATAELQSPASSI